MAGAGGGGAERGSGGHGEKHSTGDSDAQPGLNDNELTNNNDVGMKVHVC